MAVSNELKSVDLEGIDPSCAVSAPSVDVSASMIGDLLDDGISFLDDFENWVSGSGLHSALCVQRGAFSFFDRDFITGRPFTDEERGRIARSMLSSTPVASFASRLSELRDKFFVSLFFTSAPDNAPETLISAGDRLADLCGMSCVYIDAVYDLFGRVFNDADSPSFDVSKWHDEFKSLDEEILPEFRRCLVSARFLVRVYRSIEARWKSGESDDVYYRALNDRVKTSLFDASSPSELSAVAYKAVSDVVADFVAHEDDDPALLAFIGSDD